MLGHAELNVCYRLICTMSHLASVKPCPQSQGSDDFIPSLIMFACMDGAQVQICKKTFCNLHAVSKRRVENLAEKLVCGILVASDQWGKHSSRPHAISEQLKKQIRQHIESFPCRKSHYYQTDNRKRRYLSENLSISRMYLLYLEKHEPQVKDSGDKPQVKEWLYRKIFNEEYNLSFGYPRSDTCETCDLLHVAIQASKSDTEREEATSELAEHQEKASQGYSSL